MNVVFKELTSRQGKLFPSSFDKRIPQVHTARFVKQVVDMLKFDGLLATCKGGGTSS